MSIFQSIFGSSKNRDLSIDELIQKDPIILDVRTVSEFRAGHVEGSKNIPLSDVKDNIDEILAWSRPILLCCRSGNRSGQATKMLKKQGVDCENGGSWQQVEQLLYKNELKNK